MYGYNNFGNTYVPPIQPRPMYMSQPEMEQASPFNIVKFVNEKEATGYVLLPNQRALLMDTQNMMILLLLVIYGDNINAKEK